MLTHLLDTNPGDTSMFVTTGNCSCCKKINVTGVYDTYIGFVCIKCNPQRYNHVNDSEL